MMQEGQIWKSIINEDAGEYSILYIEKMFKSSYQTEICDLVQIKTSKGHSETITKIWMEKWNLLVELTELEKMLYGF